MTIRIRSEDIRDPNAAGVGVVRNLIHHPCGARLAAAAGDMDAECRSCCQGVSARFVRAALLDAIPDMQRSGKLMWVEEEGAIEAAGVADGDGVERGTCADCGVAGWIVDTEAGEVIRHGAVVASAPDGAVLLLVGRSDGTDVDGVFCDACARGKRAEDSR